MLIPYSTPCITILQTISNRFFFKKYGGTSNLILLVSESSIFVLNTFSVFILNWKKSKFIIPNNLNYLLIQFIIFVEHPEMNYLDLQSKFRKINCCYSLMVELIIFFEMTLLTCNSFSVRIVQFYDFPFPDFQSTKFNNDLSTCKKDTDLPKIPKS